MEPSEVSQKQYGEYGQPIQPTFGQKLKKALGPIGVAFAVIIKFFAKLKFLILPLIKFLPLILKTGGTMLLSVWVYAMFWGWWFAAGFVLLIFVHECGHLVVAKALRLKVGAPMFIPFVGALIALKENPSNAWVESRVGIGGPIFGALGSAVCYGIFLATNNPLFCGLAHVGFLLNLFNLAPVGFLDGGRIVTALSPWLWIVGFIIMALLTVAQIAAGHVSLVMILILIYSVPRLMSLFRAKSDEEKRYFEVTPGQRLAMGAMYFGLIALLTIGMQVTYILPETLQR
ncbi:MAG TPA: site-2 protease family protein [Verrucomicrobiae bacterium]